MARQKHTMVPFFVHCQAPISRAKTPWLMRCFMDRAPTDIFDIKALEQACVRIKLPA